MTDTTPLSSTDRYATRGDLVLVLNCGSSSIKFALFDVGQSPLPRTPVWNGKVQGIGGPSPTYGETGLEPETLALGVEHPYSEALRRIEQGVLARLGSRKLHSVAHRVVHGGSKYSRSILANAEVLADLKSYIPLAPLHQPFALEAIEELLLKRPDLPQVVCFDTAFHHTIDRVEKMLPLPHSFWDDGMRRYGFHGLSYHYQSIALPERHGEIAQGRVIVAHLGSGASMCAMQQMKSVSTTMGFSALDGVMMGTRTGAIDPGAVLYLQEIMKLTPQEIGQLLYHQSGLLGVSGVSSEPRVLLPMEAQDDVAGERARDALALYVRSMVREIGSLIAVLGGLDLLVFTAGVGEHSAEIRRRVCDALAYLGIRLDEAANDANAPVISTQDSGVLIGVEPTNEEWIAAREALSVLDGPRS